jgi:3-oxoacyl-[acyl-carrier protein] reductase
MTRLIDLDHRTALVTGGSRGVGRATALLLARAGARVGIAYRSREEEARQTLELLGTHGEGHWGFSGDMARQEVVEGFFAEGVDRWGGVDILVVNHGIWPPEDVPLAQMDEARWRRTLSVNLDSAFYLCRAAARHLRDDGRLVLVSSTAGQRGEAFHGDYAASKGALISLVKGLCVELAPRGITVNCVAPGWIDTEMAHPAFAGGARERIASTIPLGRVATPEDVAGPIVFLCTSLARHITGEIVNVNGGAVLVG